MSKNIDISIIIPLFNGKTFIKDTVDSLVSIRNNKEIIIIDDGSTDDSYEYCAKLFSGYKDVFLYRKSNGGIVDARNYGISKACGTYLMFCDQDDIVISDTVERALEYDGDCVIFSTERIIDNYEIVSCDTVLMEKKIEIEVIRSVLIPQMLTNKSSEYVSYLGHVWAGIFRRDVVVLNDVRFKRFVDIEDDYLFVFDFLCVSKNIHFIKDTGYRWRFNRKSETFRTKYVDDMLERYGKLYDYLSDRCKNMMIVNEDFIVYSIQNRIVMCVENCFQFFNSNKSEKKRLKVFYLVNRSFFKGDSIEPYVKRRRRIYWLLKKGLFDIAGLYVYYDSLVRRIISGIK